MNFDLELSSSEIEFYDRESKRLLKLPVSVMQRAIKLYRKEVKNYERLQTIHKRRRASSSKA